MCQPRQPHNVQSLQHLKVNLIHPGTLPLSFLTTPVITARDMNESFPKCSPASCQEEVLDRFRGSSKSSFHQPDTSPVWVSSWPHQLSPASPKSFSTASPNTSHTWVFASLPAIPAAGKTMPVSCFCRLIQMGMIVYYYHNTSVIVSVYECNFAFLLYLFAYSFM